MRTSRPTDAAPCAECGDDLLALMDSQLMAESAHRCGDLLRNRTDLARALVPTVTEDLHALVVGDPAARGSCGYVLRSYKSFRAVLAYRVAHALSTRAAGLPPAQGSALRVSARCISERAKVQTGIEIHPDASIGRRFVIDHGVGTVIGQTVTIGDDAYVLQGAILGATGVAGNADGPRHPTLGDRVEVAAFARILGPVTIGSDVLIGPHCVVTTDVPSGRRVLVRSPHQVLAADCDVQVYGVVPFPGSVFEIHGHGLADVNVTAVDGDLRPHPSGAVWVEQATDRWLRCALRDPSDALGHHDMSLLLTDPAGERLAVLNAIVPRVAWNSKARSRA